MSTQRTLIDREELVSTVEDLATDDSNLDGADGGVPPATVADIHGFDRSTVGDHLRKAARAGDLESVWGIGPNGPRRSYLPVEREIRTDGGTSRCWDGEECPGCGGELQQQDRFNVSCLSCEGAWSHCKDDGHHWLETSSGYVVTRKPRTEADR